MDKSKLLEWYFAGLRKQALSSNLAHDLTPISLIRADQELLKEKIEREIKDGSSESTAFTKEGSVEYPGKLSASPDLEIPKNSNESPWLFSIIALAIIGLIVCMLQSDPVSKWLLFTTLLIIMLLATKLTVARIKQTKALQAYLELFDSLNIKRRGSAQNTTVLLQTAAEELAASVQLMNQKELLIFEYCPYILCELDEEGTIKTLNQTAQKTWGYARESLLNREIGDLLHLDSIEELFESMSRCKRLGRPETVEIATISRSGSIVHLSWRTEWSSSGQAFYCMAEDISIRVEHENLKTEMRQMLTHDLKAPINNLSMWTYNMLYGSYGEINREASDSLKKTQQNLQSILMLLENLLDIDKVESGMMPSNKKVFVIQESIDRSIQLLADWAKEADVKIESEPSDLRVNADEQQVTRILTNFCSNAIKWTPAGNTITIRARSKDKQVIIEVMDRGPGIPDSVKGRLFERWTSAESAAKNTPASTGIGLYMAKKFAELQGGELGASEREGGGSIFWLSLPSAK